MRAWGPGEVDVCRQRHPIPKRHAHVVSVVHVCQWSLGRRESLRRGERRPSLESVLRGAQFMHLMPRLRCDECRPGRGRGRAWSERLVESGGRITLRRQLSY
jgi:hypothetical protein